MPEKKRKVWLTSEQVNRMLELARQKSPRDHLLLLLMRYGLRVGEIVGERGLPGIHVEDVRDTGIWVKGKGYNRGIVQDRLVPMPDWLIEQLDVYTSDKKKGKLFEISGYWAECLVKNYARLADVQDWQLVGPHRLRAFFATDLKDRDVNPFTIRDLMRHKQITTTNLYVGTSSPERLAKVVQWLDTKSH